MVIFKKQNGQALLIVVLVMVVALTVGLSVASRSITNLKTSQEQVNSQKALSAAEAGIQQAMTRVNPNVTNFNNVALNSNANIQYTTTISQVSGGTTFLVQSGNTQSYVSKDNPADIKVSNFSDVGSWTSASSWTGSLTIYWGDSNDGCGSATKDTAIEVSVISKDTTVTPNKLDLDRYAEDFCASARGNGFDSSKVSLGSYPVGNGITLVFKTTLSLTNALLVSVNPLYSDSYIAASKSGPADPNLPDQGTNISSVGSADNNNIQRKVTAFQGFPQIPAELFPYTVFSP